MKAQYICIFQLFLILWSRREHSWCWTQAETAFNLLNFIISPAMPSLVGGTKKESTYSQHSPSEFFHMYSILGSNSFLQREKVPGLYEMSTHYFPPGIIFRELSGVDLMLTYIVFPANLPMGFPCPPPRAAKLLLYHNSSPTPKNPSEATVLDIQSALFQEQQSQWGRICYEMGWCTTSPTLRTEIVHVIN